MILHYLKIAWRNLLKYRMQTAVNVVGIAVGFACFAFANHEASFDSRYEAADRMYLVYTESAIESGGFSPNVPYPTSTLLKQEFPEVEAACAFTRYPNWELGLEGQPALELPSMQLDSCFMDLFGIRILAGTPDFLYTNGQVALTERTARRLFPLSMTCRTATSRSASSARDLTSVLGRTDGTTEASRWWYALPRVYHPRHWKRSSVLMPSRRTTATARLPAACA